MPDERKQIPVRRAYVDFAIKTPTEQGQNAKRIDGLNIRFNVQKFRGQLQGLARISICNLEKSDLEYLTTYMSPWVEVQKQKRIQLFAGYEGKTGLIFSGDIIKAIPTVPPDVWLNCEAMGGYYNNLLVESFTINGPIAIGDVCQIAASKLGVSFVSRASADVFGRKIDSFCHTGGLNKCLKKINELGLCCAWIENETLFIDDLEPNKPAEGAPVRLISEDSGMVGIPEPGPIGVDLSILMDPSINLGDPIELKSKIIPSASGIYYPYCLEHTGELRGNEWYTKLKCRRFNYA